MRKPKKIETREEELAKIHREIEAMIVVVNAQRQLRSIMQGTVSYLKKEGVGQKFLAAFKEDMKRDAQELAI